jgi:hypothetical protein
VRRDERVDAEERRSSVESQFGVFLFDKDRGVDGMCEGRRGEVGEGERRWCLSKEGIALAMGESLIKEAPVRTWNEVRAEANGTLQTRRSRNLGRLRAQISLACTITITEGEKELTLSMVVTYRGHSRLGFAWYTRSCSSSTINCYLLQTLSPSGVGVAAFHGEALLSTALRRVWGRTQWIR